MLRVGVIGTSWWADRAHIPGLKTIPGVEIEAISGRNPERLKIIADKYEIPGRYTDYHDLLKSDKIQAVCIVTPNYLHYPITMEALSRRKHVLCEKPLAVSFYQAKEMYDKVKEVGVRHMVPFTWRFVPAAMRMKELIDEGYIGRVYHIEARYLAGWLSNPDIPASQRTQKKIAGTGALSDTGSHLIDFIRWTAGDFKAVVADMAIFIDERKEEMTGKMVKVDIDDSTIFMAKLTNEAQAVIHVSRVAKTRENYINVEISGEDGTLIFELEVEGEDWAIGKLYGSQKDDVKPQPLPIPERLLKNYEEAKSNLTGRFLFAKIMQAFKEGIESGREPVPNFYDGMKVQEVMQAIEDSSVKRKWIEL